MAFTCRLLKEFCRNKIKIFDRAASDMSRDRESSETVASNRDDKVNKIKEGRLLGQAQLIVLVHGKQHHFKSNQMKLINQSGLLHHNNEILRSTVQVIQYL